MQQGRIARGIVAALVGATGLSACSNTAIIHYRQPANCRVFQTGSADGPTSTSVSATSYFSIFEITRIDNSAKNAVPFAFDPRKLFVNETIGGKTQTAFASGQSKASLVDTAKPTTVAAKATTGPLGRVMISVPSDLPMSAQITETSNLIYKSTGKESVLLSRDPGPAPKFLAPCTLDNIG